MAPKLRVLISSNGAAYPPTAVCAVNAATPTAVRTAAFEGEISVFVKGFAGEGGAGDGAAYFGERGDMTYGIVVRGRYLDNPTGDDILFGNVFEHPVRDSLPWGTSIATKFMYFVDPTLELDLYADKPWALSPALSTMNYLGLAQTGSSPMPEPGSAPAFVEEDALGAVLGQEEHAAQVSARRKHFGAAPNRAAVSLGDKAVAMEFGNGILDFNTLSVTLPRPFALSINLLKYWDGQPVTYVCRRRPGPGADPVAADGVYWAVAFEIVDEEARAELAKRGGKVKGYEGEGGEGQGDAPAAAKPAAHEEEFDVEKFYEERDL
ncbi:hypothetical protein Q8F55_002304 [Vanrija albida]|uniref:Domain of unknown function at the cortex 1 domain-containing protein n=1 Tax=Vanrija albida TaxID=181172 RepID=A0ABR3Q9E6_9TREE